MPTDYQLGTSGAKLRVHDNGTISISADPAGRGLSDHRPTELVVDLASKKVAFRGAWITDSDNPGQILGGRFHGGTNQGETGFQGYTPLNESAGLGEQVFHVQGLASVRDGAGPGVPDLSHICRILYITDPREPVGLGSSPGWIVLQTTKPGTAIWNVEESLILDSRGNLLVGVPFGTGAVARSDVHAGKNAEGAVVIEAYTHDHAVTSPGAGHGEQLHQVWHFLNSQGQQRVGARVVVSKVDNYYDGSREAAAYRLFVNEGGNEVEYLRFGERQTTMWRPLNLQDVPDATPGVAYRPLVIDESGNVRRASP